MSTHDPQNPVDPAPDGPRSGEAAATEPAPRPSLEKQAEQIPAPQPAPSYEQPTTPMYGAATGQPYGPLPGQAYDPRTGMPLTPPPGPPPAGPHYSGPYHYGAYPPPGYPPYVPRPTNGMAVASLVLGILWVYWLGSILALVFGYAARQQIAQRGESGDGVALAGIVLGWIGVGVLALFLLFLGVTASSL